MPNRAAAEKVILTYVGRLTPGDSSNVEIYKKFFSEMNDTEFERFIKDIEDSRKFISLTIPNFGKSKVTVENNFQVAEDLGVKFFQRVWIEGKDGLPTYLTPNPYLVVDLPVRRASQTLTKKISVPDHNKIVDSLTGQPTGESKGAKLSYPELQMCAAMNLDHSMVELMKFRGGDIGGNAALNGVISKYGRASQTVLNQYSTGVESTKTLKTFLTSAHLKNTL